MKYDLADSLLVGGSIGFIALAIHALTGAAQPGVQLLALTLAGAALFGVQLALFVRRARQPGSAQDEQSDPEQTLAHLRHNRRNPFFRELTSDWTGLDDRSSAEQPASAEDAAPLDGATADRRPGSRGPRDHSR
ncbi:MAG: hypothetical protein IPO81_31015 [Kouleothrix sp.]|nr:hypothetical protein [Kouleothrix sp.]